MGQAKTALSNCGKKVFLIFEDTEEGTVIEMDLDTAVQVFALLYETITEAKATAGLIELPTGGHGI